MAVLGQLLGVKGAAEAVLDEKLLVAEAARVLVPALARELGPILRGAVAELGPALNDALDGLVVTIKITREPKP